MASRRSRTRRILPPIILALALAAEITGIALARTWVPAPAPRTTDPVPAAAAVAGAPASWGAGAVLRVADPDGAAAASPTSPTRSPERALTVAPHGFDLVSPARQVSKASHPSQTRAPSTQHSVAPGVRASTTGHAGFNHVWIPSLGISKSVQSFPCSRSRPPDAGVYRWGCAGSNNVYLLSHAWSTFKPLHDAYTSGRLHTGLKVVYADGAGAVHTYSVIWWKVVAPTTAAKWAWASLSAPGMTLQTCVGANSAYRLMVRLTRVA